MGLNLGSRLFEIKDSGQTLNKESRTDRIIHFNQFHVSEMKKRGFFQEPEIEYLKAVKQWV